MNAPQSKTKPHARTHAEATITVQNSEAEPYDTASPALAEIHISETFSGDIDGESMVRALGPTQRSICEPRQRATIPGKTGRTPGDLRAPRCRNRRER